MVQIIGRKNLRYERDMYEESEKVERSKDIFLNKNHHLRCFFYNIETMSKDYRKNIIIPSKKRSTLILIMFMEQL